MKGITHWLTQATVLVVLLCLASTAQAGIVRSELNSPGNGSCIGRDYTPEGRATWQPVGSAVLESFGWEVQAQTTGGWIPVLQGGQQVNGPLGVFGTLALPSPVNFRLVVDSDDTGGPPQQTISAVKTNVKVDKVIPAPPSDLRVRAVSATQALFSWETGGAGPLCGNPNLWTTVHGNGGSLTTSGKSVVMGELSNLYLYRFSAYVETSMFNRSAESNPVEFRTRTDYKTVLAGKATVAGKPAVLVSVTAGGNWTMTDNDGYYALPLAAGSYTVAYSTGCGLAAYCTPVQPLSVPFSASGQGNIAGGDIQLVGP